MPNSNDNQDLGRDEEKNKNKTDSHADNDALSDAGNFTSDDQKGKKVDGDPKQESDKPADLKE